MTSTIHSLIDEFGQAYHKRQLADSTDEIRRTEEELARAFGRLDREIEQELYNAHHGIHVIAILGPNKNPSSNEALKT
jgi:hypothetical protein